MIVLASLLAVTVSAEPTRIEIVVGCDACPPAPIHVVAYPEVDRYNWPWWEVYGFLRGFHTLEALDRLRPAALAAVTLAQPGSATLELPSGVGHVFAWLDVDGDGVSHGPSGRDFVGRFPRNPVDGETRGPIGISLYPQIWSETFARDRWAPGGDSGRFRFTDVTASSGIDFVHCQGGDIGHLPVVVGSGALFDDLDGDLMPDLFLVQGRGACAGASRGASLYLNDGHGGFRDATDAIGLELRATGMGVVGADYDSDGDLDLAVTTLQGMTLLRNLGGGRFQDVTAEAGIEVGGPWTVGASFGDVDGDGMLDLYVANYVAFSGSPPFTPDAEIPVFVPAMLSSPFAFPALPNQFYRGGLDGRFSAIADALGATDSGGKGMATTLADFDRDGDLDLFVTNDCTRDRLFENRNGRFHDVSRRAGVDDQASGMGIALGDVDGDGYLDLFSPHWLNEPPVFYRGAPGLRFEERTQASGLAAGGNGATGWAAEFFDADNDGSTDLLVTNGHTHPGGGGAALEPQWSQFYEGDGQGGFQERSCTLAEALPAPEVWRGAALADGDGDGDVDLYLVSWNGRGRLLRNDSVGGRWLAIDLWRKTGERGAIGSRVVVEAGTRRHQRDVVSGAGYLSHSSLTVEIGLDAAESFDTIEVTWPGGRVERFPGGATNRRIQLVEGDGRPIPRPR